MSDHCFIGAGTTFTVPLVYSSFLFREDEYLSHHNHLHIIFRSRGWERVVIVSCGDAVTVTPSSPVRPESGCEPLLLYYEKKGKIFQKSLTDDMVSKFIRVLLVIKVLS